MKFEFTTATRIVFGVGALADAGAMCRNLGRHALVVHGRSQDRVERLLALLAQHRITTTTTSVIGEPTLAVVDDALARARQARCDFVVAFGGGSALDAGKAVAALLANDGELLDYLEVIGRGQSLSHPSVPCVTIPTTAGTGSEVTWNSVISSPEHRVKVSLRSLHMMPRIALVDPALSLDLPPALTASTGLDALTQLIEPYVSCRANAMTDALCVAGLQRARNALRMAFADGQNLDAREAMSLASLWSGIALSNAGLGAVHGLAGPIGGMLGAPHGAVCAALLPPVMAGNIRALRRRGTAPERLARYEDVSRLLTGSATASPEDGASWLDRLVDELHIPRLGAYGLIRDHLDEVTDKALRASSMKGNPVELTREEVLEMVSEAV